MKTCSYILVFITYHKLNQLLLLYHLRMLNSQSPENTYSVWRFHFIEVFSFYYISCLSYPFLLTYPVIFIKSTLLGGYKILVLLWGLLLSSTVSNSYLSTSSSSVFSCFDSLAYTLIFFSDLVVQFISNE